MDILVSACMVLYRPEEDVLAAGECLRNSDVPVQTVLVDNCPGLAVVEQLRTILPYARYLPMQENVGFGRGNNAAIPYLTSHYHLLMNPDVTFPPDLIYRMAAYMGEHPEVAVLSPRVMNPDGSEQHLPKRQPTVRYLLGGFLEKLGWPFKKWRQHYTMADRAISVPVEVEFATGCFLMIRTEVFRRLRGFDQRFFMYQEDSDLSRRVLQQGKIVYHPDMVVTHRWQRENTRTVKGIFRQVISVARFFQKWGIQW